MQVNNLGFVASLLFVLVPAVFLLILYIQTRGES
jgi:photosystem II PsbM protein